MSENRKICKADLRAQPGILFAIWLFMIVLPIALLNLAADKILSSSETMIKSSVQNKLLLEIIDFREDLSFSGYLQNRLDSFFRTKPLGRLNAQELAADLEKTAGIKAAAIFHLKSSSNDISVFLRNDFSDNPGMISRRILQSYISFLGENQQELVEINSGAMEQPAHFTRGRSHLKRFLTVAGELDLLPGKVIAAISGRIGAGRLLLFYLPVSSAKKGSSGGCIAVFRENDIELQKVIEAALKSRVAQDLERRITITRAGKQGIYRLNKRLMNFSYLSDGSVEIEANTSEEHLFRLISSGTYYPMNLQQTMADLPLLNVRATPESLQHPMRAFFNKTQTPLVITAFLFSVILIRIYFFGFAPGTRITGRLFLAVIGASALPFSTFIAAISYQNQYDKEFSESEIRQYIQLQADQISKSVYSYTNSKELHISSLSEKLGQSSTRQPEFLQNWIKIHAAAVARLESTTSGNHTIRSNSAYDLDPLEKDAVTLTFNSMREALTPISGRRSEELLGLVKFKSKGLGLILENVGMLHNSISNTLDRVYSLFPVFPDNNRFVEPSAIIMLKFFTQDLLKDFLATRPDILMNEARGDYLIQKCFIPVTSSSSLPNQASFLTSSNFPYEKILNLAEKTSLTRSTLHHDDQSSRSIAVYIHKLNCILIVRASAHATTTGENSWIARLAAYYLILVAAVVLMLGKMLIEPISLLKIAADKVAAGDYNHLIICSSGDEFEPLTASFNSMTHGLAMKEKLASYVSDSVIQEVSLSRDITLSPGGERLEVCVIFCSLNGLKEAVRGQLAPEQITKMLGILIDTADKAARLNGGVMDKLIEDTVMLVFRNNSENDHITAACNAALQISASFPQPACPFPAKIGLASGPAVSGKIGSAEGKLDFTVIGNPVNLAARLKVQAHKASGTGILLCPNTIRMLKGKARLQFIERTEIKGRSRTFPLYELIEMRQAYQPRI